MEETERKDVLANLVVDEFSDSLDVFNRAQAGEFEPFAKYIERGYALNGEMRLWLAAFLRGELKWKKGNRRTMGQMSADIRVLKVIENLMSENGGKQRRAIDSYLDENPNVNIETLRKQLKRAKQYLSGETKIGPRYK